MGAFMISTVTALTHCVDKALIVRLFGKFRSRYGQLWTSRARVDEDWEFIIDDWLDELSQFSFDSLRIAVKEALVAYKDYPPTLSQLVDLCLHASGVPDSTKVLRMMIDKDLSHPVVKSVYDKIGSWKLANGTEKEICQKVSQYYDQAIHEFKANPKEQWALLHEYKESKLKELPIPEKIPSNAERKSFKERMDEYYKIANEEKAKLKDKVHPEFDKRKINKGGEQYEEYCSYLLSVPDNQVLSLPPVYAYDRQRLLNAKETANHLRESGYVPPNQRQPFEQSRTSNGRPTKIYKAWSID